MSRIAKYPVPLPKGVEGSIGLDSLDFIELSIAIEETFGITLDESEELTAHFASFETLARLPPQHVVAIVFKNLQRPGDRAPWPGRNHTPRLGASSGGVPSRVVDRRDAS